MKRFVSVVLVLFVLLIGVWAQNNGQWKYSYNKIKIMASFDEDLCDFDYNDDLYTYTVSFWYRYFPKLAMKYGIPFACAYDWNYTGAEPITGTARNVRINNTMEYCIIIFRDNHIQGYNAATDLKNALFKNDFDNDYLVGLVAHELCHVACYLQQKGSEGNGHHNSLWINEASRLLMEYGIDIDTDYY